MDKTAITQVVQNILKDRPVFLLMIGLVVSTVIYTVIVGFMIHPSDVTVYIRYTAFGEAHFYKSYWQYLLLFVLFGIVVAIGHIALAAKLHQIGRRQSALFTGWMGIVVIIIACVYALSVISLGRAA